MSTTAPTPRTTTPVSPKVWLSTIGSLIAGIVLAILMAIQDGSLDLAGLPTWLSAVITVILPPVIAFISGYVKSDPLRDAGASAVSPKVWLSTIGSLIAGIVLAILMAIQDGSLDLAGLPTWLSAVITVILPPVIAFISGYVKSDPLRDAGASAVE